MASSTNSAGKCPVCGAKTYRNATCDRTCSRARALGVERSVIEGIDAKRMMNQGIGFKKPKHPFQGTLNNHEN